MKMRVFVDRMNYFREKTGIMDFLLRQHSVDHHFFLFGKKVEDEEPEYSIYCRLMENLNWILWSDMELAWHPDRDVIDKSKTTDLTDCVDLEFEDDIMRIYMEKL